MKNLVVLLMAALAATAEVRTMTLRQALEVALNQNPDLILSRFDQQKARLDIASFRDAFIPKVFGGTGAAKTSGIPQSIAGNAPSIFQAQTKMALFDRPASYQVAQANEAVRGAEVDIAAKQDEVMYKVASLFLDAERVARGLSSAQRQIESLERVRELTETRVSDGRELPIESRRAAVNVARARQSVADLNYALVDAETALAQTLGLSPDDRVHPASEDRDALMLPAEERAIEEALDNSKELKRLGSNLQVKILEVKQHKAAWLPKVELVAQYALLSPYNNFKDYYNRFQYNNWQLGASIEFPILMGKASSAAASQAEIDASKIRLEVNRTRTRITGDLRRAYQEIRRAESARDLARDDLNLSREQLTIDLAQYDEGRVPMTRVESSRATEQEKWLTYYNAQSTLEHARLDVLRQSGNLLAALR